MSSDFIARALAQRAIKAVGDTQGADAYEVAVAAGFVGSRSEWLASLRGEDGHGVPGKDAYEVAVEQGFVGDRAAWLQSLQGEDADPADLGELQGQLALALERIAVLESPDTLTPLSISAHEVLESVGTGVLVANVLGRHQYEVITQTDTAGGRLIYSGGDIYTGLVGFDFATAEQHEIVLHRVLDKPGRPLVEEDATLSFDVLDVIELADLPLSPGAFPFELAAGAEMAELGPLLPGETRTVQPADGRVILSDNQSKLLRGLASWAIGEDDFVITRLLPGAINSPHATNWSVTIVGGVPENIRPPSILPGEVTEGATAIVDPGDWLGEPEISLQWLRDGSAIEGEVSAHHVYSEADIGAEIVCRVTATNLVGSTVGSTDVVGPILTGVLARWDFRSTAELVADPPRAAHFVAADHQIAANELTRQGYTIDTLGSCGFANHINGGVARYGARVTGYISITGALGVGGRIRLKDMPCGVPLNLRLCLGVTESAGNCGATWWKGDPNAGGVRIGGVSFTVAAGKCRDATGAEMTPTDWEATNAPAVIIIPGPIGEYADLYVTRHEASNYYLYLKTVSVERPSFGVPTSGVGPYYVKRSGNDLLDGLSDATAWAHIPGDQGAGGVVPIFTLLPGAVLNLKDDAHHLPASLQVAALDTREQDAGSRLRHLRLRGTGEPDQPIVIQSYGSGGRALVSGAVLTPDGWSPVTTEEVFDAPAQPIIEKRTVGGPAAVWANFPVAGEEELHPAQWPRPAAISDWDNCDEDTAGFIQIGPEAFALQVVGGQVPTGGLYTHEITWPALADHYGADSPAGWVVAFRRAGNWLDEAEIKTYDQATGRITFTSPQKLWTPTSESNFMFCVRYHPKDITAAGQYGWSADRSVQYAAFGPGLAGERGLARLTIGHVRDRSHVNFIDVGFTRFTGPFGGIAVQGDVTGVVGGSFSNLEVIQVRDPVGRMSMVETNAVGSSGLTIHGMTGRAAWTQSGIRLNTHAGSLVEDIDFSESGRTGYFIGGTGGGPGGSLATNHTARRVRVSNCSSFHGNGATIYQRATGNSLEQYEFCNHANPLTTQVDLAYETPVEIQTLSCVGNVVTATTAAPHGLANDARVTVSAAEPAAYNASLALITVLSPTTFSYRTATAPPTEATAPGAYATVRFFERNNVWLNGVALGRLARAASSFANATFNAFRMDGDERGSRIEGFIFGLAQNGLLLKGRSVGLTITNGVCDGLNLTTVEGDHKGVTIENVLIMAGNGGGCSSYGDFVNKFQTIGGGTIGSNVTFAAGRFEGVITQAMQEKLTRNIGAPGYSDRTLGLGWRVPAYGSPIVLSDCDIDAKVFHEGYEAGVSCFTVLNTSPGVAIDLPDGFGDNERISLYRGQGRWLSPPVAGEYEFHIRQTCSHPDLSGPSTWVTVIRVVVKP